MFAGEFAKDLVEFAVLMLYILIAFSHAFVYISTRIGDRNEIESQANEHSEKGSSDFQDFSDTISSMYSLFFVMLGNVDVEVTRCITVCVFSQVMCRT